MSDIRSPETFLGGIEGEVTAERLNNHVNGAQIQPEAISSKTDTTPVSTDLLLLYDTSAVALAKSTLALAVAAVYPVDGAAGVASARTLGTGAGQAVGGTDTRIPAPVTGVRKGAGVGSADTAANGADVESFAASVVSLTAGAGALNCAAQLNWEVTLNAAAVTLTLTNIPDGATVRIKTTQDATGGRTLAFVSAGLTQTKLGGTATVSSGANAVDLWYLEKWGTTLRIRVGNAYA